MVQEYGYSADLILDGLETAAKKTAELSSGRQIIPAKAIEIERRHEERRAPTRKKIEIVSMI